MPKHSAIWRTYLRNHIVQFAEESETAKIAREKAQSQRLQRQVNRKAVNVLRAHDVDDADDADAQDTYDDLMMQLKKTRGNRKNHKHRLAELQKNSDFQ